MADLFDGYPLGAAVWTRCSASVGPRAPRLRRAVRLAAADRRRGARRPRRPAVPDLPRRRGHLRPRRRGAAVPARHRAAGHRRRGVGRHRAGRRPAGARAGGLPRRRLRRRPGVRRPESCRAAWSPPARTSTAQAHGLVPPNGVRVHVSGIDLVRDEAGDFRVLEDNLRSRPGVSYVITNRRGDEPGAARAVRRPPHPAGRRLPEPAAAALQAVRAVERGRPDASSSSPRASTTPPTSSTRCWPGRWASSWSRAATWSAPATRSACGRRTASSAVDVIYRRIDDEFLDPVHFRPDSVIGCAGRAQRRPGRPGDHRQRGRQRRRRRQAALHLGARPDPLLPGRGAGAAERRHLPAGRRGTPSSGCWSRSTSWCSSRSTARAARASSSGRGPTSRRWPSCAVKVRGRPAGLDRAEADRRCRPAPR